MIQIPLTIQNKYGLHTRAVAKLVALAKKYLSKSELILDHHSTDCKSIMSLILLGAQKGTHFQLRVEGEDEAAAAKALTALIEGKFGEEE